MAMQQGRRSRWLAIRPVYSTTQRQLDTYMRVAGWILLGEDYIMYSIFEQVLITFVPKSGKLSGVWTHERYTHFENETCNINSIYTMNLQILSLNVLIEPSIHCPTEKLLMHSISHALLFGRVWRMDLV